MTNKELVNEWINELQRIGHRYHIRPAKRKDDKGARRIAVLVTNSFLELFATIDSPNFQRNVNTAGFIQVDVYEQAKQLNLSCDEIEDEERIREMGRKGQGYDPLKLHLDTGERNPSLMQFVFDNLTKEQENGKDRTAGQSGVRCPLPDILDNHEMSEIFGVSKASLRNWREKGLPYIKIGIKYIYIESSVRDWLKSVEVRNS